MADQTPRPGQFARAWRRMLLRLKMRRRERQVQRRSERIAAALTQIPMRVREIWLARIADEIPGWRPDAADWPLAAGALLQFFDCCHLKTTAMPCALPSRAADSVWHLWLAHEPASLSEFQRRHYGQALPHVEAQDLGGEIESALAQSWTLACRSEGLSPLGPKLPLMFVADRLLQTPTGWAYRYGDFQGQVLHQDLGVDGRPMGRAHLHAGLAVANLVGLGLLTQHELGVAERRKAEGSSCGSSCGSSSGGGDGGGCSCGSSCGGGCGS